MNSRETELVRVLHVDDEPDFADLAATFLERERDEFEVTTATSASAGLDRLAATEEPIDCIVSDYNMPGMDGLEFLEAVREFYPDLTFVLFTGRDSEEIASEAITAGVDEYLNKGTGTDQYTVLANRIDHLVAQYRAERELRASNERVRTLYGGITDAIFALDTEGRFTHLNERAEEVFGRSEVELLGKYIQDHFSPGADTKFDPEVRRAVTENVPVEFEEYDASLDAWHHVQAVPTGDGVTVHINDVTEKRERELTIQRQHERLQTIYENLPIILFTLDEEGRFTLSKGQGLERIGLAPDEDLGNSAFEMHAGTPIAEDVNRAVAGEPLHTIRKVNDRVFESWYRPVENEETGDQTIGVAIDITERKQYEHKLAALHDATRELMAARDPSEVATIATEAANDVLGLPLNAVAFYDEVEHQFETVGISSAARELFGEAPTIEAINTILGEVFETGSPQLHDDVRQAHNIANPDTPVRSELVLPLGDHGAFIVSSTTVGTIDDTDLALAKVLAATVEVALNRADHEAELQHQNERLEEFANVISHDLRNPLGIAQGYLELARDTSDDDAFAKVSNALDRMEAIITDVLTLAR